MIEPALGQVGAVMIFCSTEFPNGFSVEPAAIKTLIWPDARVSMTGRVVSNGFIVTGKRGIHVQSTASSSCRTRLSRCSHAARDERPSRGGRVGRRGSRALGRRVVG